MAAAELESLLHALQDRDIPLGEDDVAWAFEGGQTRGDAVSWVREYLHPSTLLTKDELDFYERRSIGHPSGAVSGRPLSDAELEAAISTLEASTAAIEKQSEILESQRQALKEIQGRNGPSGPASDITDARQKKSTRQRAQLDFKLEELAQGINAHLRSSIKQTEGTTASIPTQVERLLEKDDRLLDGLQKLIPKISNASEDADDSANVEQLCSILGALSVKEIHARLDKVYHESIAGHTDQENGNPVGVTSDQQKKQKNTLRAELSELSLEIEGLVSIVVDQQFRKPLKRGMLLAQSDLQHQKARWSEYTISTLAYLTARLDALGDHVQNLHAHGSALRTVSRTFEETIAMQQAQSEASNSMNSPSIERSGAKGLKPLRLVQANRAENSDPAVPFLRQQDIRVTETDTAAKLAEVLDSTVGERKERLATLSHSFEHFVADAIAHSFAQNETDLQDLLSAVYAHSDYHTIRLVDNGLQAEMDKLEHDTQRLGDLMRELDIDSIARAVNAKKERAVLRLRAHD